MSKKEELPFGLTKKPRVQNTQASLANIDDHLGESSVMVQTWWSGEGFTVEIQDKNSSDKLDISWTQYEALKLSVEEILKAERAQALSKRIETINEQLEPKSPSKSNAVFSDTALEILADTNMLEFHDDRGPGSIVCPVCGASIAMTWSNGVQLTSAYDLQHATYCPVIEAKNRLQQKKAENTLKPTVRRRVRALKGKS
jgi:hypothetical protein